MGKSKPPTWDRTCRGCSVAFTTDRPNQFFCTKKCRTDTYEANKKSKGPCSLDGCDRPIASRDLCRLHYERLKRTGATDLRPKPERYCSVGGCDKPHYSRDLCCMHYMRHNAHGTTDSRRQRLGGNCAVEDCNRQRQLNTEWCSKHTRLARQHGKPEPPARPKPDKAWLASIEAPPGARAVPVLINRKDGFTYALVDEADYAAVARWRWRLSRGGYAYRSRNTSGSGKSEWLYMHRDLMQPEPGLEVDHINRRKLDNRRVNLRNVDRSTNGHNTGPSKANTSGHKGVGYFKPAKLWRAYITHKSSPKRIELGYFKTKEEAIAARKAAEERLLGECA